MCQVFIILATFYSIVGLAFGSNVRFPTDAEDERKPSFIDRRQ